MPQLSPYNILQRIHPFKVGPGWPETRAMEKNNGPRVMNLALKSEKSFSSLKRTKEQPT